MEQTHAGHTEGKRTMEASIEQEKHHRSDPNKQEEWDDKVDRACGILTH